MEEVRKTVSHRDQEKQKTNLRMRRMHPAVCTAGVGADLGGFAHLLLKLASHTVVLLDAQRK